MNKMKIFLLMAGLTFAVDYESQIQTIWDGNCGNCHLGNSSGGLNLSSYDVLMLGSDDGPVIVPGDYASSVLYDQ